MVLSPSVQKPEVIIESAGENDSPPGYASRLYRYTTAEVRISQTDIITPIAMDSCFGATLIDRKHLLECLPNITSLLVPDNQPEDAPSTPPPPKVVKLDLPLEPPKPSQRLHT
ncbi:MAG: hypothetical protein MMC33_010772 [Icmadophila ericetorum]|nr:hypothetical protein [Icmadophila ericetorum]